MTIYYIMSSPQIAENPGMFNKISKLITGMGHRLANEHAGTTYLEMTKNLLDLEDYRIVCRNNIASVKESDICIKDATIKSYLKSVRGIA